MKLFFVSLGCDKNLVDSEYMLGMLEKSGFELTSDETEADVIIINTCCFIGDAKEESVNMILDMAKHKEDANLKALIVTGCLAQRYQEEIRKEIPEVDAVLGTNSYDDIVHAVDEALKGSNYEYYRGLQGLPHCDAERRIATAGHFAYLKIAEGCDKRCTYCIIPYIRGGYRSVPLEELVRQARELVASGVKELILIAQETTLYGTDLYGEKSLYRLLDALNEIPGLFWIRILYCYPEEIDDRLIEAMKRNKKVCHYLDIPIQHASDEILRRMGRRTDKQSLIAIIDRLRSEIPDICLRTTLITGFPGETAAQHDELMDFINDMEFDRLGVFLYSREEGTPAAEFPDQIDEETKLSRRDELMGLQQEIAFDKTEDRVDEELLTLIEGFLADENVYVARSYRDSPDVDGLVFIHSDRELVTGDIVKVRVTSSNQYDLIAEPV